MKRIVSLLLVSMLIITMITIPINTYSQRSGENTVVLIIAPGFDPSIKLNYTKTLKGLINKSITIKVINNAPYTLLYHELLILNTTWRLDKAIPLTSQVLLTNNTLTEPYNLLNVNNTISIWGELDTQFINTRAMNPSKHPRTINPYYNLEKNYIPPAIFKIPFNGSTRWDLLKTTLTIRRVEQGFVLKAENYFQIKISNVSLSTPAIKINISRNDLAVNPGIYYLYFRIINVTKDYAVVFTPGTRSSSGWFSKYYGKNFQRPVILDLPSPSILKKLGRDDIKWLVEEIIGSYTDILNFAYKYKGGVLNIIEFPLFQEAVEAKQYNISSQAYETLLNEAMKALSSLIEVSRVSLGKNITVIIYSPYTVKESKQNINGLTEIAPGIYNVTGSLDNIIKNIKTAHIYTFANSRILVTPDPKITGYGNGVLMIYKPGLSKEFAPKNATTTPENIAMYAASLVNGYGIGMNKLIRTIQEKDAEITQLKSTINDKESTINQLNKQIEGLRKQIGNLTALNANLSMKINELQKKIDEANKLKQEAYEYLLSGISTITIIILILYYMLRSAVTKTTGKSRKGKK